MIEPDLAEFIDKDESVGKLRRLEQSVEQVVLLGAEKAGEDRERKDRRPARVNHHLDPA